MTLIQEAFIAVMKKSRCINKDELLDLVEFMFHKISIGSTKGAYEFLVTAVRAIENLLEAIRASEMSFYDTYIRIIEAITDWSNNIEMVS